MQSKYIFVFLIILTGVNISISAQNERRFIRNGNDYYENEKYVESEVEFRKALEKEPESFEGRFNLGDALFKQKKVDDAIEQFQSLTNSTKDKKELSDVYHNIGNGFFAKKEYEKSIEAYKQALKNDPTDDETRYNLIAAQKMLDNQKKNQDQKNQDKKNQDKKQQDQKDKQKQDQQQKKDQQQQEQQQQQQQQQKQNQQQQGISKENAERILQSLDEDEKKLQKKLRKAKQQQQRQIEKNW